MSKVADITDKLTFDGNPKLKIKDKELEVNADAPTMLKIMSIMAADGSGIKTECIGEAYELVFPEASRKEINDMKLNVEDWMTVIEEAMTLITGEDSSQGE